VDDQDLIPGRGEDFLHHCVLANTGALPPMGTRGSFFRDKWPGHEADHSPSL